MRPDQAARFPPYVSPSDHSLVAALDEDLRRAVPLVRTATRIVVAGAGAGPLIVQPVAMVLKGVKRPINAGTDRYR